MNRRSVAALVGGTLAGVTGWDLAQRRHAILRNYPIVSHLRYLLEAVGLELRQYIVTDNDAERPFSRDQRRWVYTSSKAANRYFGFGTDNDLERAHNYPIIKHAALPVPAPDGEPHHPDPEVPLPAAKVLGGARRRAKAFWPSSVVNISGMSFGALSAAAVTALNKGAAMAGALHNTGEGGVSPYHLGGGELVWQIGTGYFGCRDGDGRFSLPRLVERVAATPQIRAIEIKLSEGAKPGLGGMLPGAKVTPEIAAIRGVPAGVDCKSPAGHSAFRDVDGLLELVETEADATAAERVIADHEVLVAMREKVEKEAFALMALQQPVAGELRAVFAAIDIVGDTERMGALAVHVAKIARREYPRHAVPAELRGTFADMAAVAIELSDDAKQVLVTRDPQQAAKLHEHDDAMDALYRELLSVLMDREWKERVSVGVELALLGRFYERFADHAVEIGRRVIFAGTGALPAEDEISTY